MTKAEDEVTYATAMHGHESERDALIELTGKVERASRVLDLIEKLASEQSEHPATRCRSVVLLAQLGSYYAAGASEEIAAAIEKFWTQPTNGEMHTKE